MSSTRTFAGGHYNRAQQLQIISWNVGGLGKKKKWRKIKEFFAHQCMWDVVCLQETKMTEAKLKQRMVPIIEGEASWVFSSRSHGGLAMFLHPQFEAKVVATGQDTVGWTPPATARQRDRGITPARQFWFQWAVFDTNMGKMGVCNIYGPQSPRGRKELWRRLETTLDQTVPWTFCGDLNFIESPHDRLGHVPDQQTPYTQDWQQLRDIIFQVEDPWNAVSACRS